MTFKSPTQPFCRWCGRPIRKDTAPVRFGRFSQAERKDIFPANKADAQRHVNGIITSVGWDRNDSDYQSHKPNDGKPYIDTVYAWDGETYADEFFCTGACAQRMGYSAARHHKLVTDAWRKAVGQKP